MSAMSELQPYFDKYFDQVRNAKSRKGCTLQELSNLSGVPYNNICDTNSGRMKLPILFYEAAKCKVLGLSLDALCGLDAPKSAGADRERIHELELDNARKDGEIGRLNAVAGGNKQHTADLATRIKTLRSIVLALAGFCALLVLVVIGYMVFDAHILTAGLFQSAGMSTFAVLLALLLIAAVVAISVAMRQLFRK